MARSRSEPKNPNRKAKIEQTTEIVRFDYTAAEWAEINSAVTAVRGKPLKTVERNSLRRAASQYLTDMRERRGGDYLAPRARAKSWAKAAAACDHLYKALQTAGRNRHGGTWSEAPILIVPKRLRLSLARKLIGDQVDLPEHALGGVLDISDITELLVTLQNSTAAIAEPFYWGISMLVSHTGRQDPQIVYFQHVLWLWTDVFRGKLRISRNPLSGKLSGPLVRFFVCVVRPVMGEKCPSMESIPDIVKRQRAFSSWLDGYMTNCGSGRVELAAARLLRITSNNGEM